MHKKIAYLDITCGEYQAHCDCCTTFRTTPEGVLPRARYDNKVRELVLDRILKDGMNVEQTMESLRRDFLLELSTGFVYDVLYDRAKQLDMSEHRRKVLENFSGILCVDELHLGCFTLLLATDPLSDIPVAFALVAANDQDHMQRFLKNLQTWGLRPRVVITDDSNLYPAVLAELWPASRASVVRISHYQEHQQAHSGCGATPAKCYEPAGKSWSPEETGSQKQEG